MYKIILLALFLFIPNNASHASNCDNANTFAQLDKCVSLEFEKEDAILNLVYKKLILELKDLDKEMPIKNFKREENLRIAQRTWIDFRNQSCFFQSTIGSQDNYLIFKACVKERTEQRVKELERTFEYINS